MRACSFTVFEMGVGPEHTPDHRRENAPNSLFGRIAREIADTAAAFPSDGAAESEPSGTVIHRDTAWPAPDVSTQMERPSITERQCSRSGCSDAAAITLSYHYGQSQVWLDYLSPEREPHMYDMCDRHAQRLSVPRGWHLDDRRGVRSGSLIAV